MYRLKPIRFLLHIKLRSDQYDGPKFNIKQDCWLILYPMKYPHIAYIIVAYMHNTYVYTYAWTCSCNPNGEDFGKADRQTIEGNHLPGNEEHNEGDDYSGRTGRSRLGEVEEVIRSSAERQVVNVVCKTSHSKVLAFHSKAIPPHSRAMPPHSKESAFRSKTLA